MDSGGAGHPHVGCIGAEQRLERDSEDTLSSEKCKPAEVQVPIHLQRGPEGEEAGVQLFRGLQAKRQGAELYRVR